MVSNRLEHIVEQALDLSTADRLSLLDRLVQSLEVRSSGSGTDLGGIWRDRFAHDFDIDGAIQEARTAWRSGEAA
jgi:hypothetical protein